MVIDDKKNAWISTFEDGLLKIQNGKVIQNFTEKSGLLSNYLGKLKVDKDNLWITTDNGLQLYDVKIDKFQNLLKSDGLETYDFVDLEVSKYQDRLSFILLFVVDHFIYPELLNTEI